MHSTTSLSFVWRRSRPIRLRNWQTFPGGKHQPTLLRYLDGWPRRKGQTSAFIQFIEVGDELTRFVADSLTWQ